VRDIGAIPPLIAAWDLGRGESEVLTYAFTHPEYSAALQIPMRGTLGVALLAKQAGLIEQLAPVLQALQAAGLRLSPQIAAQTLHLANE
jgi:predicted nucleic acid-binding protein